MSAAYSIAYGRETEHAEQLMRGLTLLPSGFIAEICDVCKGRGEYQQTFNNGCGMGFSRMRGGCDYCDGTGLLQNYKPAPASVRNQVLVAAEESR